MIELKTVAIKQEKLLYAILKTNKAELEKVIQNKQSFYYSFDKIKKDKRENNNSFVFLENSTLNMLILYLLMNGKSRTHENVSEDSQVKNVEARDHIIADSKKDFEEILTLLKEKF